MQPARLGRLIARLLHLARQAARVFASSGAVFVVMLVSGCAQRLPLYGPMADAQALNMIASRQDSVRSMSCTGDVRLADARGETVTLDGAFVVQPPDRARLRAWKFGSSVLDVTILPDSPDGKGGVWAYAAARDGSDSMELAGLPAAAVARCLELLSGDYFRRCTPLQSESQGSTLVVEGSVLGQDRVRCEIDRATLTPRRFVLGSQNPPMELLLSEYQVADGIVCPGRIEFRGNKGTILVRFDGIEINSQLPVRTFVPSSRAAKLP